MPQDCVLDKVSEQRISCPSCGHHIFITIDPSAGDQDYYDECPACCNDIHLNMHIDEYRQKVQLAVNTDDEQIF
ncbi:CPXCG motif-containing cysteine-rich protein [Colwellia sp. 1_MG-2023]|uniref:CPXCG motif-containing cysteine-rich protein n=1 Tax=Thalassotalea castellviae TaxID=3075612 RepID=A0ABU3A887_9GAMM|nr:MULTISPECIES: CPXCG motif-containing cysteine-rich protein [Colwelliaceae]MDO6447220.1 CPXCG motif-containing cysteine-rich protein [Colwellia sp. 1_MG-2023]MDT0605191.1 CPXCG motif-containing cysteine-rich protein [Thalassotalea sp. W431]